MNEINPLAELPMGFGMALAQHPGAMQRYTSLSSEQQSEILAKVKTVQSKSEMKSLVSSLVQPLS